jgi:hypothetical protein
MKRFVDLTAPTNSEDGVEYGVEETVDLEIQKKVRWTDEVDQRKGRKGAKEAEVVTEGQEQKNPTTCRTRGKKRQSAVRADPDEQLFYQPWASERECSASGMDEGGTDRTEPRYPLRVQKQWFALPKSVLPMACLAWPAVDGSVIVGGKVGSAVYPALSLLAIMLLATPLEGSKKIKLSSHGVLFQSIGEHFFSDSEWVIATDFTFQQADTTIVELTDWLTVKRELPVKAESEKSPAGVDKSRTWFAGVVRAVRMFDRDPISQSTANPSMALKRTFNS